MIANWDGEIERKWSDLVFLRQQKYRTDEAMELKAYPMTVLQTGQH
jgi:hypothetical protein